MHVEEALQMREEEGKVGFNEWLNIASKRRSSWKQREPLS